MRAAIVTEPAQPPIYAEFPDPVAEPGEALVRAHGAARSSLAKAQAAGKHYRAIATPFVPGVDGVGTFEDGTRVYFAFPRAPYGSMAEIVPVRREYCVPLPEDLSNAVAAAGGNPGMSSMAGLVDRAALQPGESVLINGATGISGRLAVQIAKHLGAKRVVAVGRSAAMLEHVRSLGADAIVSLAEAPETLVDRLRAALRDYEIDVVLDYLWGPPAASLLQAIAGHGGADAERRIRFIQIGSSAGDQIMLSAKALRSSGIEVIGSGLGSVSYARLVEATGRFLQAAVPAGFEVTPDVRPLSTIAADWDVDPAPGTRVVYAW